MLRDPRLGAIAKAVHAYLTTYALESGVWPPKRTMLAELALSETTLRHALRDLEAYGYLRARTRAYVAGEQPSMLYTLLEADP
jgi:DNA-binding FadR family transcriptional regulator